MGPVCRSVAVLVLAATLAGCGETTPQKVELPPPETFTWTTGQPISFSPPPEAWNQSRYQNGGTEGVSFVLAGSRGEQIFVAEQFFLGRRDGCGKLREILENLEEFDRSSFRRAIGKARLYAPEPYNAHEEHTVDVVNELLDHAAEAFSWGNLAIAHDHMQEALEQAGTIRYTVEETVDQVLFTRERNTVYPSLQVDEPVAGEVSGATARIVKFTFEGHGTAMIGRRVYVVQNNRMFEFGFQGIPEHLALFESILQSVTFPPGSCEH